MSVAPVLRAAAPAAEESPFPRTRWMTVATVVAVALLYTTGLWAPLAEPDEPRYAEIAREMLVRNDWVTPTLNFVKYFEKPPLVYWWTAATFRLFGIGDSVARLPVVCSALLGLLVLYHFTRRAYDTPTAVLATLILATAPLYCAIGQVLVLDLPLTFFVTLGLTAFWNGHQTHGRWWYRLAYIGTALGILTKGPIAAVLVGGVAGLYLLIHRDWRGTLRALDPLGIALAVLIALPWFVLVSQRNPEFLRFFIEDQHMKRFLTTREHRQPFWLYAAIFPLAFTPWGLLWMLDPSLWREHLSPRRWSPTIRFLLLWATFVLIFFSCSVSKLLTYILPAMPPFAVILARMYLRSLAEGRTAFLRRGLVLLLVLGVVVSLAAALGKFFVNNPVVVQLQPYLFGAGLTLALAALLMRTALRKRRADTALMVMIAGTMLFLAVCMSGRGVAREYRDLGLAAGRLMRPGDRLAVYIHYVQGLVLYSRQRVILIGSPGELSFGRRQATPEDAHAFFWDNDARLIEEWRSPQRLFLVINRHELAPLRAQLDPPPIQLATHGKKVLIVNHPVHD